MKAIVDIEANGLLDTVSKIWCIISNPLEEVVHPETGELTRRYDIFVPDEFVGTNGDGDLTMLSNESYAIYPISRFNEYSGRLSEWIGHNFINYDSRALKQVLGTQIPFRTITDTMILSQISSPKRQGGHSLKSWGMRFEDYKGEWDKWDEFAWGMVDYCLQDVRVNRRTYEYLLENTKRFSKFSIQLEHQMRRELDTMQENGFHIDQERVTKLRAEIQGKCSVLETEILKEFPPQKYYKREFWYPRVNASGVMHGTDKKTLDSNDWEKHTDHEGNTYYNLYDFEEFNLRSTKQILERMEAAGWKPVTFNDPTDAAVFRAACEFTKTDPEDIVKGIEDKKERDKMREAFVRRAERKLGFDRDSIKGSPVVCEENFNTLPEDAPASSRKIAKWFLLDKRVQKLDEWLRLLSPKDSCIHGQVFGCGAHTMRATHSGPNTANISRIASAKKTFESETEANAFIVGLANAHDLIELKKKEDEYIVEYVVWGADADYSTDMRACWTPRTPARRLCGIDLSGIQLRALAHYADDAKYTEQILSGDIHSYNAGILFKLANDFTRQWSLAQTVSTFLTSSDAGRRNSAKTYIYAYLLGAGNKKVGVILNFEEAWQAEAGKFIREGFANEIEGLGRLKDWIRDELAPSREFKALDGRLITVPSEHLCLAIMLQSFEAIVMKYTIILAMNKIREKGLDALLVGWIHDEVQVDCAKECADEVGQIFVESMQEAGRFFKTKIPTDGAYHVGNNWAESH